MSKHLEHNNLIARWMDDSLSDEEKEALKNSGELDALKNVIEDIDTWKMKPFDAEGGLAKLKKENEYILPINKTKNSSWVRIAASVAILLSCGLVWYLSSTGSTTITTKIAENKTIDLPTGSFVKLDAASSITYDKNDWKNNRFVTLSGQAYFNVSSGVPFRVSTNTAIVSVLGTEFNIRSQNDQFIVFCYEGKIDVSYNGASEIISKGQSILLQNGKLRKSDHNFQSPEWMKGFSTYEKASLKNVIADLKRYYIVDINLPEKYETLQFTGTIEHKNLQQTLETIFTTMEIKYSILDDNTVIFE
ncbi:FecR family protein [Maribacter sp. Asnod1-A12]|uniref:FecR family protein n=1 Tax=Maribacter sp. Asnod1-A12 TaxID=3160576 RepID=UPI003863A490